ncbi:acetoacetate decarboxylase family protein [Oscillibacter sp. MSJ-2]|uniref:Acetoacetate decarboxylase family protein n=1 Tax=Dysosmobacter acutus TaxID=2841504 RepID=A0ABS6FCU6_9FIRM|nr:acetoacetate decarboxylase family protein [Dysosmobacter acutus]MBU5628109.1 acetoacetate decarboxylase family protein [Dysosmobacter acutus]
MQNFRYVPYEPIVGNVRKVGETVFLAELAIDPAEFASRVPEGFQVISDKAYVAMTEAVLRDEKSRDYDFINPIYSQYYSAGILVEAEARGHRGWTYALRYFDRDWAVMESRVKGFDAFYAHIRTTRFPTEMMDFYHIQEGSRLKAVATDEGTRPISLGFDADKPVDGMNFDFLFANRIGLRRVVQLVEERRGESVCDDITRELITKTRYGECWQGRDVQLAFDEKAVGTFSYEVKNAFWFMMGYQAGGIEVL